MWPEVESLQDYKNTFPKWKPSSLASQVKNLDEDGLDLLSVSIKYVVLMRAELGSVRLKDSLCTQLVG